MKLTHLLEQYLSRALLIKLSILLFLLLISIIIYIEQSPPTQLSFEEFELQPLRTSLSLQATFRPLYISESFSVLELQTNSTNKTITGIIQENISKIDSSKEYLFSGKVAMYRGNKQLDIYTIPQLE